MFMYLTAKINEKLESRIYFKNYYKIKSGRQAKALTTGLV